jgi:hypothetical protein
VRETEEGPEVAVIEAVTFVLVCFGLALAAPLLIPRCPTCRKKLCGGYCQD